MPSAEYGERWFAELLGILAADAPDQLVRAGEHGVESAALAEDVDFVLHLAEGMQERGTSGPAAGSSPKRMSSAAPARGPSH